MKAAERSSARLAVVQALYQMEVGGKGLHEVQAEFEAHWIGREIEGARYRPAEVGFFREVLNGVLERAAGDRHEDRFGALGRLATFAYRDRHARDLARRGL